MDSTWRPLFIRDDPELAAEYDALHEGIPPWLVQGITRWVESAIRSSQNVPETLEILEQLLQVRLKWTSGTQSAERSLVRTIESNAPDALKIIDACLMVTQFSCDEASLQAMLDRSGSAWTIGTDEEDNPGLERRVDATVTTAAREAMSVAGNSSRHLRTAWHALYGVNPDASKAYSQAVKAVEAAGKPMISPTNTRTTLGTMIRDMRAKPFKWSCVIGTVDNLIDMMSSVWSYQRDRHGDDDVTKPVTVSPAEAQAALHLALTLVQWFRDGTVRATSTP